ncbi:hypothetical protein C0J52_15248 [Blattella germanica]|nr:hypothetical protein C0J52_15248 [Blattella germanica]
MTQYPVPVVGESGVPGSLPAGCEISTAARTLLQRLLDPNPRTRLHTLLTLQATAFYKDFSFPDARTKKLRPLKILESYFPDEPVIAETSNADQFIGFESYPANSSTFMQWIHLAQKLSYENQNVIVFLTPSQALPSTFSSGLGQFFRQVFLPQGYPESVSDDYYKYQIWDTVQAFSSTLSGTLTTQAIMKGVGVEHVWMETARNGGYSLMAIRNNMADVSAKDGSQETFVNLCASIAGIIILSTFDEGEHIWEMFLIFTIIHLYANYQAVKSLKMVTVNISRLNLLIKSYLCTETVNYPDVTNLEESVILGTGFSDVDLCGFRIRLGASLQKTLSSRKLTAEDIKLLANFYRSNKYLLLCDIKTKQIFVTLQQGETTVDVIQAYFHAVVLSIAVSIIHNFPLKIMKERGEKLPLFRLEQYLERMSSKSSLSPNVRIPLEAMMAAQETMELEFHIFASEMHEKGWSLASHHLNVDEWRGEWKNNNRQDTRDFDKAMPSTSA